MKNIFTLILVLLFAIATLTATAQNIGINNPTPAPSALLDLSSTNKGFLAPRMTTAERLLIPAPANGLLVYDLTVGQFFYFDGSVWKAMGDGGLGWLTTGNAGTTPFLHFIGTLDGANLAFKVNNVPSGMIEEGLTGSTKLGYRSGFNSIFDFGNANVLIGAGAGDFLEGQNNVMIGNEAGSIISFGQHNTIIGYRAKQIGGDISDATIVGAEAGMMNNANEVTFFGREAGRENFHHTANSYFGFRTGRQHEGDNNAAFGDKILLQAQGNRNSAFGSEALSDLNVGDDNAVFGYHSAHELSFGFSNAIFGSSAGQGLNDASFNSIYGTEAGGLMFSVNYDGNAFFGYRSGANTQTDFNSFFGTESGFSHRNGHSNSFFGARSAFSMEDGTNNAFFGDSTGFFLGQFSSFNDNNNTFVGSKSGRFYQSGNDNTLVGAFTGSTNQGSFNTLIGTEAASGIIGSSDRKNVTALGYRSGYMNNHDFNTFVGSQTGMFGNGSGRTFVGSNSGNSMIGTDNVLVGDSVATFMNFPASFNTFIGSKAASMLEEGEANTAVGYQAMSSMFNPGASVSNVTAIGAFAGQEINQADNSTFVGFKAGQLQFGGNENVYVGSFSGLNSQNSSQNTAIGNFSASQLNNSSFNVAVGYHAGFSIVNSSNNVYIGKQAGENANNTEKNVVIGTNTYPSASGLSQSVAIGESAGTISANGTGITLIGNNTQSSGFNNATAIGHRARVTTDNSLVLGSIAGENGAINSVNVGVGTSAPASRLHVVGSIRIEDGTQAAGRVLTSDALGNASWQAVAGGSGDWSINGNAGTNGAVNFIGTTDNQPLVFKINNTFAGTISQSNGLVSLGFLAGNLNTGNSNTFIGHASGDQNTIGQDNTFVGSGSGGTNNSGSMNTFIGTGAGALNSNGISNSFTGYRAGFTNSTGNQNAFYGKFSGTQNNSGSDNSFYGTSSGLNNTSGNRNSYFGSSAGHNSTTGVENTILGQAAGLDINTGSHNTFAGSSAGDNTTTGHGNTFIGDSSGTVNFSGNFNSLLGYKSNLFSASLTNATAIGHLARVDASNSMVLGSVSGVNGATATVNVGIGVNTPAERLHVAGKLFVTNGFSATDGAVVYTDNTNYLFLGPRSGTTVNGAAMSIFGSTNASAGNAGGIDINTISGVAMRVNSNGNVGIGTATPNARLEVNPLAFSAVAQTRTAVRLNATGFGAFANNAMNIEFGGGGTAVLGAHVPGSGGRYDFVFSNFSTSTNFTEKMRITGEGRVGIGTTTPGGLLELALDQGRKPGTGTWTIVSDERLKNINGNYSKGLSEILQLNPIVYHYRNSEKIKFADEVLQSQMIGFSAQEVQQLFPEAVLRDENGYLNLNMHAILVAYTNAFKEQQQQIEELTSEKNQLVKSVDSLEEKLQLIEAKIRELSDEKNMSKY